MVVSKCSIVCVVQRQVFGKLREGMRVVEHTHTIAKKPWSWSDLHCEYEGEIWPMGRYAFGTNLISNTRIAVHMTLIAVGNTWMGKILKRRWKPRFWHVVRRLPVRIAVKVVRWDNIARLWEMQLWRSMIVLPPMECRFKTIAGPLVTSAQR